MTDINPLSFIQTSENEWAVFCLGSRIGIVIAGQESAYYRNRYGNGRLFPSLRSLENKLASAALKIVSYRAAFNRKWENA